MTGIPRRFVFALFLLSGTSGLLYEVAWSRMLATVLGTTVYAVATVLAVFMGGLALGSYLFGRIADRPGANGLRLYGLLELAIGAYAVALPLLLELCDVLYRAAWPLVEESWPGQMVLRVALAAAVLIVPATLMGGTLPVLSRFLVRAGEDGRQSGREIGLLYACNTLGAVTGVLVTGFFLLEHLGVRGTLATGALVSGGVGALAVVRARRAQPEPVALRAGPPPAAAGAETSPLQVRAVLWVFGLSGFAALALEVLWTRSLMYFVSVDTWAFSAMLAAFLLGIGLGSLLASPWAARSRRPVRALALLQVLVGLTAAASVVLLPMAHDLWQEGNALRDRAPLLGHMLQKLMVSGFVMLVPTLLMGMSFPLVSRIWVGAPGAAGQVGSRLGVLYALNTVGAIAGSVLAGFALIPWLGLQRAILLVSCLYLAGGALLSWTVRPRTGQVLAGITAAGAAAAVLLVPPVPVVVHSWYFRDPGARLLYAREGAEASLAIFQQGGSSTRQLNINGIVTAADNYWDMQVHRMLSHLPMLLHPDPQRVLIVGFGMGSTAYGCCQHDVERVDVVELLRAERETAPFFEHVNHGVLEDPKLHFIEGDGRNYLLASRERYDVISFNAIHPRYSANLYTTDFYRLCRQRLTEDGVLCAWLTQNAMTAEEWKGLCSSLVEVFPHTSLWWCNPEHYCLVASMAEPRPRLADWRDRMARPGVRGDLADSNLDDPLNLAARFLLAGDALAEYCRDARPNTDDLPWIEFSREVRGEEFDIAAELIAAKQPAAPLLQPESGDVEALARREAAIRSLMAGQNAYWYRNDGISYELHYKEALLAAPEDQDVRHHLGISRQALARIEAAARENPADREAALARARALREAGQLEQSAAALIDARRRWPQSAAVAAELVLTRHFQGDAAAVLALLERLRVDPRTRPILAARLQFALGEALSRQGRTEEGEQAKAAAEQLVPPVRRWFVLTAQQIERLGQG